MVSFILTQRMEEKPQNVDKKQEKCYISFVNIDKELLSERFGPRGPNFAYFILTWHRGHCDQQGSSPRSRLFHCTLVELKPAIPPNVGNSGA